ncbi:polysaccharide deacetylase family protein [Ciceribacter sp. L1K23]|uniref:polysaccharide deacetylase family protein n=1 Tax=Ciceribacter sp. L1K23 TaxID=2820276 RepID=UPI001B845311|nr:polysaccharide deacetylase family protein [Ciceribacter sp. L1K23]MBR0556707.1 polysaccharide deacetylase family protein [Ciceribacter sp. L1K23]
MLKNQVKRAIITGGLEAAYILQSLRLLSGARGRGAIFTLHHVRPYMPRQAPINAHLEITPEFLDTAIRSLKADGYRFVRLEDVPQILMSGSSDAPFAVFTLDDGFRDNAEHALPVFQRHGVPFTVFVCKGFSERTHVLWWEILEKLVNQDEPLEFDSGDGMRRYPLGTRDERYAAAAAIGQAITSKDEADATARLVSLATERGIDAPALTKNLVMDGNELRALAAEPLASLGAHTVSHRALAVLGENEVTSELADSADYVASITGTRPTTFAYPYGDGRSVSDTTIAAVGGCGFDVAVTTRPGTLSATDVNRAIALPRISLNGHFQKARYVSALASGIPFKLTGG